MRGGAYAYEPPLARVPPTPPSSPSAPAIDTDIAQGLRPLGDLGYEGEADAITIAFKKPKNGHLTDVQQMFNQAHNGLHAIGERGNALLKTTFKALRHVSLSTWRIGHILAAALVLLPIDHASTT